MTSMADTTRSAVPRSPLLETQGLVKRYGGLVATDHVDLKVRAGECHGIIGPNGAGKSTLIGLLGGELRPTAGRITYCGRDITSWAASKRARRGIARTYQIPRPFLDMSVEENLQVTQFSVDPYCSWRDARAERFDILDRCHLVDCANMPARALPLLRRKRLEVARALALRPTLLLLDEVGAGLVDSEVTELIALIHSLAAPDRGIVIIEHVIRLVRECCEDLTVINFGKTIAEGPTEEVLASDDVAAVYLGATHGRGSAMKANRPKASARRTSSEGIDQLVREVPLAPEGDHVLLRLEALSAGYGLAKVLRNVDLEVRAGQAVVILGTNGAGKTTLANTIAGGVRPNLGRITFDGEDITDCPSHVRAQKGIAHCMEGRRIFGQLSVEENLCIAARGISFADRHRRLDQVYSLFPDLSERRDHPGTAMSGGQQQMLAIGRALMSRPKLVIFDEISLGLSPIIMDKLYLALHAVRAAGLTMLVIEQDVDRAMDLADNVRVLEHGTFALSGTPEEVYSNPRLRQLYIGDSRCTSGS